MAVRKAQRFPIGMYGDGNQGAVIFDGTTTVLTVVPASNVYTLTADIEVTNMTINAGVTVRCAGFIPRISGTLTIASTGILTGRANDGVGSAGGASISGVGSLATTAASGGNGKSTAANGDNGTGSGSNNITGTAGASGGNADGTYTGGTGNNTVAPTAARGRWRNFAYMTRGKLSDGTAGNGSGGGGGGGCNPGTGTATSGGGGSAAIPLHVFCRYLNNLGTIHANGGAGAAGVATGDGKAGGGGGGAGGAVFIVCDAVIAKGTITATGGIGGAGAGGGVSGSNGTTGYYIIFTPTNITIG